MTGSEQSRSEAEIVVGPNPMARMLLSEYDHTAGSQCRDPRASEILAAQAQGEWQLIDTGALQVALAGMQAASQRLAQMSPHDSRANKSC